MSVALPTLAVCMLILFSGCTLTSATIDEGHSNDPVWHTITASEANVMMAELDNFVLLDVRTPSEFQERRIAGAINIPYDEIISRSEAELQDKSTVVLVYCQSGRRSALAAASLTSLGFTAVYDFGGILNWPYETVR